MNELQIFNNEEFGQIRTSSINDEPWFIATDICKALDIKNVTQAVDRLDEDERSMLNIGRQGETNIVNEYGLYNLILASRKQEAKVFKRWVTHEVIPAIRHHGVYVSSSADTELASKEMRAKAMLLNAQNRTFKMLRTMVDDEKLSDIALQVFGLKTIQEVSGVNVGNALPEQERLYSATEIAEVYNVTACKVGKVANANNLKTDKYGKFVLDKSPHSNKTVTTFRYNKYGMLALGDYLGKCPF